MKTQLPLQRFRQGRQHRARHEERGEIEEVGEDAVRLDPQFALAWARLARIHSFLYSSDDHTPARLEKARVALDQARRWAPNESQTLIAEGYYYMDQQQEDSTPKVAERVTGNLAEDSRLRWRV